VPDAKEMIAAHITAILMVTGLLTMGVIVVFLMPSLMLRVLFGVPDPDEVTRIVARHWGLLVALIGTLLVVASYHPELQFPVMAVAAAEKLAIAGLVLGSTLRRRPFLLIIAAADALMAILYLTVML
jgi:hypothetical protein